MHWFYVHLSCPRSSFWTNCRCLSGKSPGYVLVVDEVSSSTCRGHRQGSRIRRLDRESFYKWRTIFSRTSAETACQVVRAGDPSSSWRQWSPFMAELTFIPTTLSLSIFYNRLFQQQLSLFAFLSHWYYYACALYFISVYKNAITKMILSLWKWTFCSLLSVLDIYNYGS